MFLSILLHFLIINVVLSVSPIVPPRVPKYNTNGFNVGPQEKLSVLPANLPNYNEKLTLAHVLTDVDSSNLKVLNFPLHLKSYDTMLSNYNLMKTIGKVSEAEKFKNAFDTATYNEFKLVEARIQDLIKSIRSKPNSDQARIDVEKLYDLTESTYVFNARMDDVNPKLFKDINETIELVEKASNSKAPKPIFIMPEEVFIARNDPLSKSKKAQNGKAIIDSYRKDILNPTEIHKAQKEEVVKLYDMRLRIAGESNLKTSALNALENPLAPNSKNIIKEWMTVLQKAKLDDAAEAVLIKYKSRYYELKGIKRPSEVDLAPASTGNDLKKPRVQ